jgi:thiaminase/transcriptional activator TenA
VSHRVKVTAEELWKLNRDTAEACLGHPFVQGIASGDLSRQRFQVYVAQDACFLEAFARAYALALAKSPDREGIAVFKDLLVGVFEELTLHESYARRWGVSLEPEPLPSTSAYCDFLLRTASFEPVGRPDRRGPGAVHAPLRVPGQPLAPKLNPESPYREWVETCTGAATSRRWPRGSKGCSTATAVSASYSSTTGRLNPTWGLIPSLGS